jgi:hypothetical protein
VQPQTVERLEAACGCTESLELRVCEVAPMNPTPWKRILRLYLRKLPIQAAKSAVLNGYLYRGLFSRVRVVPALKALGVSLLEGST